MTFGLNCSAVALSSFVILSDEEEEEEEGVLFFPVHSVLFPQSRASPHGFLLSGTRSFPIDVADISAASRRYVVPPRSRSLLPFTTFTAHRLRIFKYLIALIDAKVTYSPIKTR